MTKIPNNYFLTEFIEEIRATFQNITEIHEKHLRFLLQKIKIFKNKQKHQKLNSGT